MRTKTFLLACATMVTMGLHAQSFESAADAVKNMGVGWNLGNTLDANGDGVHQGVDSETYWGQPKTKPELIKMMKEAGFGAIRVPVTWYNHMDSDGKIDAAWMTRVKEVVDYVINNGLYCILNVHHDTGDDSKSTNGNIHWIHASMNTYNNTKTKYEYLWKQIAETFKDYDQHLLFEGYNEMLDDYNSWCFASYSAPGQYNATSATDSYNAVNSYARSFVNSVRGTGGNNVKRNLVINTYAASNGAGNWNEHLKEPLTELKLPTDLAGSGHIAVQVHSYPDISNINTAKTEIEQMFKDLKKYFIDKGTPIIVGEWASSNVDATTTDYDSNRTKYLDFASYYVKKAKEFNACTFYWMGLSDGMYRSVPAFNQPDLAETIAKAYHGSDFQGVYPTMDTGDGGVVVFEGEFQLEWGTAINFPANLFTDLDNSTFVEVTYQQKYDQFTGDDAYGMFQFWYNDWSSKIKFTVGGKQYDADFNPADHYGTPSGTMHTTAFSFDESTFNNIKKKGVLFQGHGIKVTKAILTKTPTGISNPTMVSRDKDLFIYNLNGQRVENPRKGIYIVNGKMVVIK